MHASEAPGHRGGWGRAEGRAEGPREVFGTLTRAGQASRRWLQPCPLLCPPALEGKEDKAWHVFFISVKILGSNRPVDPPTLVGCAGPRASRRALLLLWSEPE